MSTRWQIALLADNSLILKAPIGYYNDPSTAVLLDTGATVTGYLFDRTARTKVIADGAVDTDVIFVESASLIAVGDPIGVYLDDRSRAFGTVTATDTDLNTVTVAGLVTGGRYVRAADWNYAQKQYGSAITMSTTYGTAAPKSRDWGYVGLIEWDFDWVDLADKLRAEIDFNAGTGLRTLIELDEIGVRVKSG